jgi:hypothetical protein
MGNMSPYDKAHVQQILLGRGDWFGAQLLRLIEKADKENREKLRLGFPDYVAAFELWDAGLAIEEDSA